MRYNIPAVVAIRRDGSEHSEEEEEEE